MNQEEIESLNRPIKIKESKSVKKKFPNRENPRTRWFHGWFYQTLKEKLIPILLKLSKKYIRRGNASKLNQILTSTSSAALCTLPEGGNNPGVHQQKNGKSKCGISTTLDCLVCYNKNAIEQILIFLVLEAVKFSIKVPADAVSDEKQLPGS